MNYKWLIIDGYNLLYKDVAFDGMHDDLQIARQRLVRKIERAASQMALRITVVFDGREKGRDAAFDTPNIEVVFSPANMTADGVIERLVATSKKPEQICVVTSDNVEAQIVSSSGAFTLSCVEFIRRCGASEYHYRKGCFMGNCKAKGATLGDFFPKSDQ